MGAPLHRVGLQDPAIPRRVNSTIASVPNSHSRSRRSVSFTRASPSPIPNRRFLAVSKARVALPVPSVVPHQRGRTRRGVARRQRTRIPHVLVAHADHRRHRMALCRHRCVPQRAGLTPTPHPVGSRLRRTPSIGHGDNPPKPDHIPEPQAAWPCCARLPPNPVSQHDPEHSPHQYGADQFPL